MKNQSSPTKKKKSANKTSAQVLIEKELREVRKQLVPLAQTKGIYNDKDVQRLLSIPGMRESIRKGLKTPLKKCSSTLKWE